MDVAQLSKRLTSPYRGDLQPCARWYTRVSASRATAAASLESALSEVGQYLKRGGVNDEASALTLVRELKETGQLVGYDAGRRLPKRSYTLSDLRLHKIDGAKLLAPQENTLSRLKSYATVAYIAGVSAGVLTDVINFSAATAVVVATGLLIGIDQIRTGGGVEFLLVEWLATVFQPIYQKRVALHEAGHFLVAYLSGLLPKNYTLSALDYYKKHRKFNIQAGTTFCDSEFQQEIQEGQLKATSLDRVTCVAVAGVVAEYLSFGHSEGGLNDILQLDQLMRSLKFSQKKVDSEVRWAVMNTKLADYMGQDRSVTECIQMIEDHLKDVRDI